MAKQEISTAPRLWSCNWNWCPETFRDSRDLGKHLQECHYNNILKVKKRDWDAYLRSTEGRSGATDSLLAAIPDPAQSMQSSSQDRMEVDEPPRRSTSGSVPPRRSVSGSVRHRSPLPMTPPPVPPFPRNDRYSSADIPTERQHPRANFNAYPSPGEERQASSPSSSQLSVSDAKRRRMSFASYRAQSSPMSTPSVASVPPSPSLPNMVADAINRTGQLNEASPSNRPHSQSQSRKPDSGTGRVPPLPRRTSLAQSPTAAKPRSYPSEPASTSSFHSQSQPRVSSAKAANSPGAVSVGSAQAVEEALTQNVFSSVSSRAPNNSGQSSGASSSTSSSPPKHAQPQLSSHSFGSSHAGTSHAQAQPSPPPDIQPKTEPLPDVKPLLTTDADSELAYPPSSESSPAAAPTPLAPEPSPPVPRRRARSKTPAPAPAPSTRTLRSRSQSKTSTPAPAPPPMAAPSQSMPLPRTRTRSRAGSQTNADPPPTAAATTRGQRATSKPPSAGKRAGSVGPAAGGRKGTRTNAGGLAAVDEQPDEAASQPAVTLPQPQTQTQTQAQAQAQRPPTFRSGTLQLPRRQQIRASQAQSQSQSRSQSQSQPQAQNRMAAVATGRFGEDEAMDVKVKRELLDAEPISSQHQSQNQSQSQDGGAWNGFELNPMELLTQKPFPSQSQGWGSSQ